MVDIMMVTYNRLKFTKITIDSILKRTKYPYRLIIVDNNSTDGTKEYLKDLKFKGVIDALILNKDNIGLEKALNVGFLVVRSMPYFVTVDNDCIAPELTPCWLTQMVDFMDNSKYDDYGAMALRPQVLIGVGDIFKTDKEVVKNNVIGGSYRIMRTEVVKEVGGWTDKFENNGRGNEEHDICGKLDFLGYKVGYIKNMWTYHMFGNSLDDIDKKGNWGYNRSINAAESRSIKDCPYDEEYNENTCEPKVHHNE